MDILFNLLLIHWMFFSLSVLENAFAMGQFSVTLLSSGTYT